MQSNRPPGRGTSLPTQPAVPQDSKSRSGITPAGTPVTIPAPASTMHVSSSSHARGPTPSSSSTTTAPLLRVREVKHGPAAQRVGSGREIDDVGSLPAMLADGVPVQMLARALRNRPYEQWVPVLLEPRRASTLADRVFAVLLECCSEPSAGSGIPRASPALRTEILKRIDAEPDPAAAMAAWGIAWAFAPDDARMAELLALARPRQVSTLGRMFELLVPMGADEPRLSNPADPLLAQMLAALQDLAKRSMGWGYGADARVLTSSLHALANAADPWTGVVRGASRAAIAQRLSAMSAELLPRLRPINVRDWVGCVLRLLPMPGAQIGDPAEPRKGFTAFMSVVTEALPSLSVRQADALCRLRAPADVAQAYERALLGSVFGSEDSAASPCGAGATACVVEVLLLDQCRIVLRERPEQPDAWRASLAEFAGRVARMPPSTPAAKVLGMLVGMVACARSVTQAGADLRAVLNEAFGPVASSARREHIDLACRCLVDPQALVPGAGDAFKLDEDDRFGLLEFVLTRQRTLLKVGPGADGTGHPGKVRFATPGSAVSSIPPHWSRAIHARGCFEAGEQTPAQLPHAHALLLDQLEAVTTRDDTVIETKSSSSKTPRRLPMPAGVEELLGTDEQAVASNLLGLYGALLPNGFDRPAVLLDATSERVLLDCIQAYTGLRHQLEARASGPAAGAIARLMAHLATLADTVNGKLPANKRVPVPSNTSLASVEQALTALEAFDGLGGERIARWLRTLAQGQSAGDGEWLVAYADEARQADAEGARGWLETARLHVEFRCAGERAATIQRTQPAE